MGNTNLPEAARAPSARLAAIERRSRAFTLVELITVVALVAILAAIAPPALQALVGNSRLSATAISLLQTLALARADAIKRGQPVVVCRSGDPAAEDPACGGSAGIWTTGYLAYADVDGDGELTAGTDILVRTGAAAPGQVEVRSNDTAADALTFNPDGTLASGGATGVFGLCDGRGGAHGRSVEVLPVGHALLRRGSADNPVECGDD